jgi:hypothetical protein
LFRTYAKIPRNLDLSNRQDDDIVILSAKESSGLETWLNRNGYKIPRGTKQLLQPYIRSSMKFFVAKVNKVTQSFSKFHSYEFRTYATGTFI